MTVENLTTAQMAALHDHKQLRAIVAAFCTAADDIFNLKDGRVQSIICWFMDHIGKENMDDIQKLTGWDDDTNRHFLSWDEDLMRFEMVFYPWMIVNFRRAIDIALLLD